MSDAFPTFLWLCQEKPGYFELFQETRVENMTSDGEGNTVFPYRQKSDEIQQ
jgi:hypothetical protein